MVVMPLPWLRQPLGIHCRINCETRISTVPPSDATSVSTIPGALSALVALCDYVLYKSTFTLHYITLIALHMHFASLCILLYRPTACFYPAMITGVITPLEA